MARSFRTKKRATDRTDNGPQTTKPPDGGLSLFIRFALKKSWSGRRGSNPRPRPWQGRALPLSYTRIRDVGDRSPATAELCQMQAVNATVRARPTTIGVTRFSKNGGE